jgi:hypothetical protein
MSVAYPRLTDSFERHLDARERRDAAGVHEPLPALRADAARQGSMAASRCIPDRTFARNLLTASTRRDLLRDRGRDSQRRAHHRHQEPAHPILRDLLPIPSVILSSAQRSPRSLEKHAVHLWSKLSAHYNPLRLLRCLFTGRYLTPITRYSMRYTMRADAPPS